MVRPACASQAFSRQFSCRAKKRAGRRGVEWVYRVPRDEGAALARARDCEFTRRAGELRGWVILIDSRSRRWGGAALIPKWVGGVVSGGGMGWQ